MPFLSDEEVKELKKQRPLTGSDFVDAYQLGFDAGCMSRDSELAEKDKKFWEKFDECSKQKERADGLEEENARLREKVKKLKKQIKTRRFGGE